LLAPSGGSVTKSLNAAGAIEINAPYQAWRFLMQLDPNFHRLLIVDYNGNELMDGYWHTRDDSPMPGEMTIGGSCIMDELRIAAVPRNYAFTNWPVSSVLAALLELAPDWSLGDTSLLNNVYATHNFSSASVLEAMIEVCESSGNFMRCDGINRSIDVLGEMPSERVAHFVYATPTVEWEFASDVGRVTEISVTEDAGNIYRGVSPMGANYSDDEDQERDLTIVGKETLPAGFSFEQVYGQLCIVNEAVDYGLVRSLEFRTIEALSNTDMDTDGTVESSGPNYIRSDALRRPDPSFWTGAVAEFSDSEVEYHVISHANDRITGSWGTIAVGTPFQVRKEFDVDDEAIADARQALADAAVAFLGRNASPRLTVNVTVSGLGSMLLPGQLVHLECIAHADDRDKVTDMISRYVWDSFSGDLVVISATANFEQSEMSYTFDLSNQLSEEVSQSGLYELRRIPLETRSRTRARGRGTAYTVRITDSDTSCGTASHAVRYDFDEAYGSQPTVLEVLALDERYSARVTGIDRAGFTVCATAVGISFDQVNVLVRVRKP
jgi:hypothetical protein